MRGKCFCEAVEFEIDGDEFRPYQCHCSQCRRQSGSQSNSATLVPAAEFRWLSGQEHIHSWSHASGFRSDFRARCGSPVPNPPRGVPYVWVPAGLLEEGS